MFLFIRSLLVAIVLLVYGVYLVFFKEIISNRDIIIILLFGFAYIGDLINLYSKFKGGEL